MSPAERLIDFLDRLITRRLDDAAFEACDAPGPLAQTVRQITEFGRAVAAANSGLTNERRALAHLSKAHAEVIRAEAEFAKRDAALARSVRHAARALGRDPLDLSPLDLSPLDQDPSEGDEMDTDERPSGRMDRDDLEQVRRDIEGRIARLVGELERKGMLDRVLALRPQDRPPELDQPDQPGPVAP